MKSVNLYEAKTHLSALVNEALDGEDVVLARNGEPLVRLVPVRERKPSDGFGLGRDQVWIAPDFDDTPPEFEEYA